MKKRVIGILVALVLIAAIIPLVPALAQDAGPLDHVVISPEMANVIILGDVKFTAHGQDSNNVTIPDLTYSWAVVNGGGTITGGNSTQATFTANITGVFTNTIQVTVMQNDISKVADASVNVTVAPTLDHVVIKPETSTLVTGGKQKFIARVFDSNNVTIPGLTYTWSVVNGGGTIDNGLFTAGNVTGTFSDTVKVEVSQGTITVSDNATIIVKAGSTKEGKKTNPPGCDNGKKNGWDDKDVPPGWDKGNKQGWSDEKLPPGLAKNKDNQQDNRDKQGKQNENNKKNDNKEKG